MPRRGGVTVAAVRAAVRVVVSGRLRSAVVIGSSTLVLATALLLAPISIQADDPRNVLAPSTVRDLQDATRFELLSIEPDPLKKPKDAFHGWPVLGRTVVADAAVRTRIVTAVQKGIADSDGSVARCFNPRHGIRVQTSERTVDLLICFECQQVQVFEPGRDAYTALTTRDPQASLDAVLTAAKVPLGLR